MKTSVLVTAVAGSGKSTTCAALHRLGYNAFDIETLNGLYELIDEKTGRILTGNHDQTKWALIGIAIRANYKSSY